MFNLHLNNFRSFRSQDFKFSRVNILIGENSGGKSSLLKFLLALKQTIESPYELNLKLKGDYADLGNYAEVVYLKKVRSGITAKFSDSNDFHDYVISKIYNVEGKTSDAVINSVLEVIKPFKGSETALELGFTSKLDNHQSIKTRFTNKNIGSLKIIQVKDNNYDGFRDLKCELHYDFHGKNGVISDCLASKEGFFSLVGTELRSKCKDTFQEEEDKFYWTFVYFLLFQNYLLDEIHKIRFVNPIGSSPKRFYFQEDKKASYNQIDIEKFVNVLTDPAIAKKDQAKRIEKLNEVIRDFGIAEEIQLIKDPQLPVLALNVKTKNFWSNITDVGYGVSLQIPILFQALISENYTRNGQTILIEQPEVHLHPNLQAKFIETLLGMGSKNSYFIETHSEHILRKLQVLVKRGDCGLKPEDISVHYFKRNEEKFQISEHKIGHDGKLKPRLPSGFFDTSYSLVKELL